MSIGMAVYVERKGWPAASVRELKDATETAMRATAKLWHGENLPEHFTPGAVSRYGYKPRTKGYLLKKARRKGHQRPLEWSGELRRQLTRSAKITRTTGGVTIRMQGRALNFSGKVVRRQKGEKFFGTSRYPNMQAEVVAITQAEENILARVARKVATASLNQIRASKRTQAGSTTGGTTATV